MFVRESDVWRLFNMSRLATSTCDFSSDIYTRALAADRDLNSALKLGDLPDSHVLAADDLLQEAYETLPDSLAGIVALADLAISVEDLDHATLAAFTSIRDAARRLAKHQQ